MKWVPVYRSLIAGAKKAIPRAHRWVFVELLLLAADEERGGVIALPPGIANLTEAVHLLVGGNRKEVRDAMVSLTSGPDPMVFHRSGDGEHHLEIPSWSAHELAGAKVGPFGDRRESNPDSAHLSAAERAKRYRQRKREESASSRSADEGTVTDRHVTAVTRHVTRHPPRSEEIRSEETMGEERHVTPVTRDGAPPVTEAEEARGRPSPADDSGLTAQAAPSRLAIDEPDDPPPRKPTSEERYAAAFAAGVSRGTGVRRSKPEGLACGDIAKAIQTHGGGRRGDALTEWIESEARAMVEKRPSLAKFGGFTPKNWLRWLDDGRPADAPPSGVFAVAKPFMQTERWDPEKLDRERDEKSEAWWHEMSQAERDELDQETRECLLGAMERLRVARKGAA